MASTASLRLLERRLHLLAVLTVFFGVVVTAGLCLAHTRNRDHPGPFCGRAPEGYGHPGGPRSRGVRRRSPRPGQRRVGKGNQPGRGASGGEGPHRPGSFRHAYRREDIALCDETTASGSKKREDMERRVALGEEIGADMVLSIHMNEYRDRSQSGPQVFYRQESDESRLLAGCMQAALISALAPPKERAALAGDYFILRLPVPSVLIECGFISNSAEEKLLLDSAYQARLGEAIAQGVMDYLSLEARRSATPG